MVLIKTEVPISDLPEDHPARKDPGLRVVTGLPHPSWAPQLQQKNYQHEFAVEYREGEPQTGLQPHLIPAHQDYRARLLALEQEHKDRLKLAKDGPASFISEFREHTAQTHEQIALAAARHQQAMQQERVQAQQYAQRLAAIPGSHALQDYQMQLLILDQQEKKQQYYANSEAQAKKRSLHDYQMQLMLLEQQNKKRYIMKEQEARAKAEQQTRRSQLQDYQMQLMLLEQQNKKRIVHARQVQPASGQQPSDDQPRRHQLQDYQMQLMLLEQQNKKRLMMARQLQDAADATAAQPSQDPAQSSFITPSLEPSLKNEETQTPDLSVPPPYHIEPQVVHPCQALPGTPGTVCAPPMVAQEFIQNSTLVIRGGPPSSN